MRWLNNLKSVFEKNDSGRCPYCNSADTDYGFVLIDEKNNMGCGAIWCNQCRQAYYISRIEITDGMRIKEIPKGLKF